MDMQKVLTGINVLTAAQNRIDWAFDTFKNICVSFSGGKDSTVLLHLVADVARYRKRKISILFVDWEDQFTRTIEHIIKMKNQHQDVIDTFYWVALPMTTVSGVSQYEPEWVAWAPGEQWVRRPPTDAITDEQEKDLGYKDIPSWRRICKTLIRNDFWCLGLSFSPNKPRHYHRYLERMKQKRKQWGLMS